MPKIDVESWPVPVTQGNPYQVGGKFLAVITAAGNVNVQAFKGSQKVLDATGVPAGIKIHMPDGFDSWAIQFSAGGNGNATIAISDEDIDIYNLTGNVNVITLGGSGLVSTADVDVHAGGQIQVKAANAARRTIIVGNPQANVGNMRVGDANTGAAQGQEIAPGQSIAIDTQAAVYIYIAAHAGNVATVLEILA